MATNKPRASLSPVQQSPNLIDVAQAGYTQQRLSPSVRQTGQMYAPNGVRVGTVYNQPVNRSAQAVVGAYSPYATVMYAPEAFDPYAFLDRVLGRMYQPNAARQQMIQQALSQPVKMPRFGGGGGAGVSGGRTNGASKQAQQNFVDLGSWNAYIPDMDMRVPAAPEQVTVDLATGAGKDPDGNPIQLTPRAVSPDEAPMQYNGTSDRFYATDAPLGDTLMPPSSVVEQPVTVAPNAPAVQQQAPIVVTPNADAVQQQTPIAVAPSATGADLNIPNTIPPVTRYINGKPVVQSMRVPNTSAGMGMEGSFDPFADDTYFNFLTKGLTPRQELLARSWAPTFAELQRRLAEQFRR